MFEASLQEMSQAEIEKVDAALAYIQKGYTDACLRNEGGLYVDAALRFMSAVMATVDPAGRVLMMMRIATMADKIIEATPTTTTPQ